jgi:hypothetical protein
MPTVTVTMTEAEKRKESVEFSVDSYRHPPGLLARPDGTV